MNDKVIETAWTPITEDGFDGWLALPPAGSGPGLLLWQEIFGVNAHIRRVAEQYALAGFVVLAPDLFWRDERRIDLGYGEADRERGMAITQALQREQLQADIRASVDALRSHPACSKQRVGTIGYCLGGRLAYLTAAWTTVDAAVSYYGGGIQDQLGLQPEITAPLQFHFAGRDRHIPQAAVDRVRTAVGNTGEVFVYPEAQHGFNCWARSTYDPASAALAHGRSLAFLADKLF